jgi:Iap family predicted aminopeptidase
VSKKRPSKQHKVGNGYCRHSLSNRTLVLSVLVLYKYLVVKRLKIIHSGLTEIDVRQIHRKPAGETSGSCQIDEPARESVKLITTRRKKRHYYLKTVAPPTDTFMKDKRVKVL